MIVVVDCKGTAREFSFLCFTLNISQTEEKIAEEIGVVNATKVE